MIDRCFRVGMVRGEERHYVFDFLDFCAFPNIWRWTFNVADAFVCVGAGILMVWCICAFVQETKQEKQKKLAAENGDKGDKIEESACESSENTENIENADITENAENTENSEN